MLLVAFHYHTHLHLVFDQKHVLQLQDSKTIPISMLPSSLSYPSMSYFVTPRSLTDFL